jgi:hypothetical protein
MKALGKNFQSRTAICFLLGVGLLACVLREAPAADPPPPAPTRFTCQNWVKADPAQKLSGTLLVGQDRAAVASFEYQLRLPSKTPYDLRAKRDLTVSPREPGAVHPLAEGWTFKGEEQGNPDGLSTDLDGFVSSLNEGDAQVALTQMQLVLPKATTGLSRLPVQAAQAGAPPQVYSTIKFRLSRDDGSYLDLLSLWSCSLEGKEGR